MKNVITVLKILAKEQGKTMLARVGKTHNPFKILITTILSARARDEVTEPVSKVLLKKYPTAKKLASAKQSDVEKIIKRIGFYRNKSKNIIETSKILVKEYNSKVPEDMKELLKLAGVGNKVAACVMVYAFNKATAIPIDTHVNKIANRLGWVKTKSPNQTQKTLEKIVPKKYWILINDVFVVLGKTICLSSPKPKCNICPIRKYCKRVGVKKSV